MKNFTIIICLIIMGFYFYSCTNKVVNQKRNSPVFLKATAERDYRMKVNPTTMETPKNGAFKAIQQLVNEGKIDLEAKKNEKANKRLVESDWQKYDDFFPAMAISAFSYNPLNTQEFYFCTGEGWGGFGFVRGAGIWKSEDAGESWFQLASTANNETFDWSQDIVVHPTTGFVYLATAEDGLYRSIDGGATWEKVLGSGVFSGGLINNSFVDIEITANGGIFASTGIFNAGRIYYSETGNAGDWELRNAGLPSSHRLEMATAASNDETIYCITTSTSTFGIGGIFKSTNKGLNWIEVNNPNGDYTMANSQAWYDLSLAVDPNDENIILAGGFDAWKSANGGQDWTQLTVGAHPENPLEDPSSNPDYMHVDQHAIHFVNSDTVYFTNDGGIYRTANLSAETPIFQNVNDNYNVTQFYTCKLLEGIGNEDKIIGGTQDNGTLLSTASEISPFTTVSWFDGGYLAQHSYATNMVFTTSEYDRIFRVDLNTGEAELVNNIQLDLNDIMFINPIAMNPTNPDYLYQASNIGLWRLPNCLTSDSTQWELASSQGVGTISIISFSRSTPNRVFIGRELFGSNGLAAVFMLDNADVSDGNNTWTSLDPTQTLPISDNIYTSCIHVNKNDDNHILITYSNYGVPSIFESKNAVSGNGTFTNIEGDLPDVPVFWIELHPNDSTKAYIATEIGVFYTNQIDGANTNWILMSDGIPFVWTNMLNIRESDMTICAATHGRGIFTATLDPTAENMDLTWTERGPSNVGGRTRAFMINPNDPTYGKMLAGSVSGGLWSVGNLNQIEFPTASNDFLNVAKDDFTVYPNPIRNGKASLQLNLQENKTIKIDLIDNTGRLIQNIDNQQFIAGLNKINFDLPSDILSGIYFLRISDGKSFETRKLIVH